MNLRNIITHGRTYSEMTEIDSLTANNSNLNCLNRNYQTLREYFNKKGFIKQFNLHSNTESLWSLQILLFLFSATKSFQLGILNSNDEVNFIGIKAELYHVYKISD